MTRRVGPSSLNGCSLTRREALVINLSDAGLSIDQIVMETGLRRAIVQTYVSKYHCGPDMADAKWRNDLISASFMLLERVTVVHGRHPA